LTHPAGGSTKHRIVQLIGRRITGGRQPTLGGVSVDLEKSQVARGRNFRTLRSMSPAKKWQLSLMMIKKINNLAHLANKRACFEE
jgi:hypothetical protein